MQRILGSRTDDINIPRAQRRGSAPALASIERAHKERNRAILAAHDTGRHSYARIGKHFGVHFTTMGRIVRAGKAVRSQGRRDGTLLKRR